MNESCKSEGRMSGWPKTFSLQPTLTFFMKKSMRTDAVLDAAEPEILTIRRLTKENHDSL